MKLFASARTVLLLFGVALVSLWIGEALARSLGLLDRIAPSRRLFAAHPDPDLPFVLRANSELQWGNVHVRVNSEGLRGAEIAATGESRILVVGDSVVFGQGIAEPETFCVRLEEQLRKQGVTVQVLNGAAPGYNTTNEVAFLRHIGLPLRPDVVVLGVSLNDFGPAPRLTGRGALSLEESASPITKWLTDRSELFVVSRWAFATLRRAHWWQAVGDDDTESEKWAGLDRYIAKMHKSFYADPGGPDWEQVRVGVRAIRELGRRAGFELVLVVFPEQDQIEGAEPDLAPQRAWRTLCREFEIDCLDLEPAFARDATRGPLFLDTQHPNGVGMEIAARATANALAPMLRERPGNSD